MELDVGTPVLVASKHDRDRMGLHHWVDGTFGRARLDGHDLVVAPNGPRLAVHRGRDGIESAPDTTELVIGGLPPDVDHASGGPLLVDPRTGAIVLTYHGETFADGDPMRFTSFLGMAVSHDGGHSFRDLGPVVRSGLLPPGEQPESHLEIGPGGMVAVGRYAYLYFQDRRHNRICLHLGVARCLLDDVFAAAHADRAPVFTTLGPDGWTEPGLGGIARDLMASAGFHVMWFDVAVLAGANGGPPARLLVFSTVVQEGDDGVWRWMHMAARSPDGLSFEAPVPLYDRAADGEMLYVTIESGGPDQRFVEGGFDLYRVVAGPGHRWDSAVVERVPVTIRCR